MSTIAAIRRTLQLAGVEYALADRRTIVSACPVCNAEKAMTAHIKYGKMQFQCLSGCSDLKIMAALGANRDLEKYEFDKYGVDWTDEKTPKLVLPDAPGHEDLAGQLAWITSVLNLDRAHPVTQVAHLGQRGQNGDIELTRVQAPPIRFEPAATLYSARRFLPALGCQLLNTDAETHGFKDEDCRKIARVIHMASETCTAPNAAQEGGAVVGTFRWRATAVEGHTTYGNEQVKYAALHALARDGQQHGGVWARYLIDSNTGEIAIRVSDLAAAAREYAGCSLPHGWLDSRMASLGWERVRVRGHAQPGREGRSGPHLRCDFYRGHDVDEASGDAPGEHVST